MLTMIYSCRTTLAVVMVLSACLLCTLPSVYASPVPGNHGKLDMRIRPFVRVVEGDAPETDGSPSPSPSSSPLAQSAVTDPVLGQSNTQQQQQKQQQQQGEAVSVDQSETSTASAQQRNTASNVTDSDTPGSMPEAQEKEADVKESSAERSESSAPSVDASKKDSSNTNTSVTTAPTKSNTPTARETQSLGEDQENEGSNNNTSKPSSAGTTNETAAAEAAAEAADAEAARKVTGSISEFLAEVRAQRERVISGGYIEVIEWLFVFLLVAPGTFPAIGCVLYGCTSLMQRRFGAIASSTPPTSLNSSNMSLGSSSTSTAGSSSVNAHIFSHNGISTANNNGVNINDDGMYGQGNHGHLHAIQLSRQAAAHRSAMQRNTLLDNTALLTSRTRHKALDERDDP